MLIDGQKSCEIFTQSQELYLLPDSQISKYDGLRMEVNCF
jgi:hypothetical protein